MSLIQQKNISRLDDEDGNSSYRWEQGMARSWDTVQEDAEGRIVTSTLSSERERSYRAKQHRVTQSIRRGLIRYLVVVLDCSSSSLEKDIRPSRFESSKRAAERFINEFYDQNPISQLSIAITRDRIAEKVTELSANPKSHINALKQIIRADGLASLQNILLLAIALLRHIPDYGHRELLIVYNSITTCDPGDIFETIEEVKRLKIRCSIISTTSEIYICSRLAELTNGTFTVANDNVHLSELILRHTTPPPELKDRPVMATEFIYMGFPKRTFDNTLMFTFEGRKTRLANTSFICPRCTTRTSAIPTVCCVCSLQLNSSSHIARSHHHLFPVPNFNEVEAQVQLNINNTRKNINDNNNNIENTKKINSTNQNNNRTANQILEGENKDDGSSTSNICNGCMEAFSADSIRMQCPRCNDIFCVDCDLFIHDSLHNCPGCGIMS
eukprot:gene2555-4988_t